MRTIKCRGRDERGYWHIGWLVETNDGRFYIAENDEGWTDDGFHNDDFSGWYNVLEKTIGQFIGLLDKNGKEIYEGDILEIAEGMYAKVVWNKEKASFEYQSFPYITVANTFYEFNMPYLLIVGNIHDNPELLEGGKNE